MKIRQNGNITIEVVLGFSIITIFVFIWVEICFLSYTASSFDHQFYDAVITAKKTNSSRENSYSLIVKDKLIESSSLLMGQTIKKESIKVDVTYYSSFEYLANNKKSNSSKVNMSNYTSTNMPLAMYKLSYSYKPVLINFVGDIKIYREVLALQEKERSQFK